MVIIEMNASLCVGQERTAGGRAKEKERKDKECGKNEGSDMW